MMHGFGHLGFMWISPLVILILFFLVFWWIVKNNNGFGYSYMGNESASDILKKRLARGEIEIKEYNKLKKELNV